MFYFLFTLDIISTKTHTNGTILWPKNIHFIKEIKQYELKYIQIHFTDAREMPFCLVFKLTYLLVLGASLKSRIENQLR